MICRKCKKDFEPLYRNGILMSKYCISCLIDKKKNIDKRITLIKKKEARNGLKTHSQWLNDFQKVFNEYIRVRDYKKPCISCQKELTGKYDAGHYFAVGGYANLRFNETNVHGQCVHCNQHLHGNNSEYSLQLPLRIGQEQFDLLISERNKPLKLSTEEIKEQIAIYKDKIKQLKSKRV